MIAPILGPEKHPGTVGWPAPPNRVIFDALICVLRSGCQWQVIPRETYAPGSTVHGRFRQGVQQGVFVRAWPTLRQYYDKEVGIAWKWQALDGVITKAPLGGEDTGPSPVDRSKTGTRGPAGGGSNRGPHARQNGGSGIIGSGGCWFDGKKKYP